MKNSEQPAFAIPAYTDPDAGHGQNNTHEKRLGLTKREYFAAMAMQGMLSNSEIARRFPSQDDFFHAVSVQSKYMADEQLKQLDQSAG